MTIALAAVLLTAPAGRLVRVDDSGVLRWQDNGDEVALFGVNYYPMFYAEYQEVSASGNVREALERDLDQFVRLGFDLIRIHCFDREFSTPDGGIVQNEHLAVLDHLVAEAKERGIYVMLTPIAWWPTVGDIGGFSSLFTMQQMTTDEKAWAAQTRFLREFVTHLNPETGLTYGDDPAVPLFELINEPIPPDGTTDETVTKYIDTLVDAVRSTGCAKPLFYNGWGPRHEALAKSKVDGCTFGWYPTGLGNGASITSDCLGAVDSYDQAHSEALARRPKTVYEFDCADTPNGELYPAMARSFRAAGMQTAAQFQYDMTATAWHNAHWVTHYMNLVYAPRKALALMVAGQAFHRLPRGGDYGHHPQSDRFGDFRVSYDEGLAEMAAEDAFIYNAGTPDRPPSPERLRLIAGRGSSSVVSYEGTGAYFLDKLTDGIWKLEVYPDSVWVADPFAGGGPGHEVSRVYYRTRKMTVRLPGLGGLFSVQALDEGKTQQVTDGSFTVTPGAWLLTREDAAAELPRVTSTWWAPPEGDRPPTAWAHLPELLPAGRNQTVRIALAGPEDAREPGLRLGDGSSVPLRGVTPYEFEAEVPGDKVAAPELVLTAVATFGGQRLAFPGAVPWAGDQPGLPPPVDLVSFRAMSQPPPVRQAGNGIGGQSGLTGGSDGRTTALRLAVDRFTDAESWIDVRLPVSAKAEDLSRYTELVVRAKRDVPQTLAFELALVMDDGTGYGGPVTLPRDWADVRVPLASLPLLWGRTGPALDLSLVVAVNIGFGPYTVGKTGDLQHAFTLESIHLAGAEPVWRVPVVAPGEPVVLMADGHPPHAQIRGPAKYRAFEVAGADVGASAYRVEADGFAGQSVVSMELNIGPIVSCLGDALTGYTTLVLRMRAGDARTNACEVVLREADGTPWGTNVPLTAEWQDVRLPLSELSLFKHWGAPEGRGFEGDTPHPEHLRSMHFTFGAWLFPETTDTPHAVEIEGARLER